MRHALLLTILVLAAGCGAKDEHADHDHAGHEHAAEAEGGHVHEAPRGGKLVVLEEETMHVEVLLDPDTGRLSLYVLGAHADTPVRVAQPSIDLTIRAGGKETAVALPAVASELTGETVGDSSEFGGAVEALKGAGAFEGEIASLTARGSTYERVSFTYP